MEQTTKKNFEQYGDIWYEPLYKSYRTCDEGPIAFLPLQQQVQQQQLQVLPAPQVQPPPAPPLPLPPQALPGVAPLPPAPQPPYCPLQIRKRGQPPPDLPPIQEEDEDRPDQKLQRLDPGGRQVPQDQQGLDPAQQRPQQPQHPKVDPDEPAGAGANQELDLAFEQLAISPPNT